MDSPRNLPEPATELADATGPILLPPNVTTTLAEDLRVRLVVAADHDEEIVVDATATYNIGQAALQLLIAARREARSLDLDFRIEGLSADLRDRLVRLDLGEALGLLDDEHDMHEEVA